MIFKIGIIGCGHVGKKRAENLGHRGKLFGCYDIDKSKSTITPPTYPAPPTTKIFFFIL